MIEPAYWLRGNYPQNNHNYKWIISNIRSVESAEKRAYFRQEQEAGVRVMIHFPLAYKNDDYAHLEPHATVIEMLNQNAGWLYDANGDICMLDNTSKMIDLRNRTVVKKMLRIYSKYIVEQGFAPDAWFVDFIWTKINWLCNHYPRNTVEEFMLDEDWEQASNFAIGSLKFNLGRAGEEWQNQLYYVNGWHHCPLADAMCYEHFPNIPQENGEKGSHVALFGDFGVIQHKQIWDVPPMLMPAETPKGIVEAVAFAGKYCQVLNKNAIIVDNSGVIFDALEA